MKSSEVGDSIDKITLEAIENSATSLIPKDAVLIVVRSGILARTIPIGIATRPLTVNQDIKALCPNKDIDPRYLHYFMQASEPNILNLVTRGATVHRLSTDSLKALKFPKPPRCEQQRIVAILDEAFAGLATATANAEKNLKNARELFESYLLSIFADHASEWEERAFGELCALFVDSAHRTPKYQPEGIPALRPRDVVNGKLSLGGAAKVSEQEYEIQSKRHRPAPGDVVYSRELSYGWAALLPETPRICLSQGMCLFRPKPEMDVSFLLYVLNGPVGRQQAMQAAVGTAHPHINLGDIKSYRIPFPTIAKQKEVVEQLDSLSAHTQRLAGAYTTRLKTLSHLKQSILQKAFSGELKTAVSHAVFVPTGAIATDVKRDTALVIALAYERHKKSSRDKSFRHTKEQKILHVVEAEAGFNLGRQPIRDAAGPNDFRHMLDAEEWAESNRYFKISEHGTGYQFQPLARFSEFLAFAKSINPITRRKIEHVIDVFIPMDAQQAEVFATVYAAWNNLLIEGRAPTDDEIIKAAREDWHPNKLSIPRAKFVEGLRTVKTAKLIPQGQGKFVPPPAQGRLDL